jgi:hypothetical protein
MNQTAKERDAVTRLHSLLHENGVTAVELKEDYDKSLYLSVPTEYHEAVEIEVFSTSTNIFYTLVRRAWDRTGGVSAETEVAETNQPHLAVAMLQADLTWLAREAARQQWEAAVGGSES